MPLKFDNETLHYRSDSTYVYTTEEEIEALRAGATQTWTPAINFGGGSTGITYVTQTGNYVRIGRALFYYGQIELSSKGSSTGIATISMPVTSILDSGIGGLVAYANMASMSAPMLSGTGGATVKLRNQSATGHTDATDANFANNTIFWFSGFYLTS